MWVLVAACEVSYVARSQTSSRSEVVPGAHNLLDDGYYWTANGKNSVRRGKGLYINYLDSEW